MNFYEVFSICPLTGLPTEGRAKLSPIPSEKSGLPERWVYEFKPIGYAIFPTEQLRALNKQIHWRASSGESYKMSSVLAGLCREAAELKREPLLITGELYSIYYTHISSMYTDTSPKPFKTFDEKRAHFLDLLNKTGGKEYIERDIDTFDDFTMAYADNAEEFQRIINSLLDEKLLRYDEDSVVQGDWVNGILAHYHGMLPVPNGKLSPTGEPIIVSKRITNVSSPGFTAFHSSVQKSSKLLFTNGHYRQAVLDACIALDKAVQEKAGLPATQIGVSLMTTALSAKAPLIRLSVDSSEQTGFMNLYQGSVQAIRNHYGHNLTEIPDPNRALEWLSFLSALFYKLDEALPIAIPPAPASLPPTS